MSDEDVLRLIDEPEGRGAGGICKPWKVAIIDDDRSVHDGTRLALSDYVLNGQGLELLVSLFGRRRAETARGAPGCSRGASRRHHGNRRRRAWV